MAEVIAITGGVASFAQILSLTIVSCDALTNFYHDFHDAPAELQRIRERIVIQKKALEDFQNTVADFGDTVQLSPGLHQVLAAATDRVRADLDALHKVIDGSSSMGVLKRRKRISWAGLGKRSTERIIHHLNDSESLLASVINTLNARSNFLILRSVKRLDSCNTCPSSAFKNTTIIVPGAQYWTIALQTDCLLRALGIYGSYVSASGSDGSWKCRVALGYTPPLPTWMFSKRSISVNMQLARLVSGEGGWSIASIHLRVQNRVPSDSPFLVACKKGDVPLMRQLLEQRKGYVGDRSICTGKTPLLLAIENEKLDAVKFLLEEAGADPNIGDDDQVLPVFAVAGMRPRRNKRLPQLPPTWDKWVDALQALVDNGASVHDVTYNRPISTLHVLRNDKAPQTLPFFRLLISQSYIDFESTFGSRSAIHTAIMSKDHSIEALRLLVNNGVNINRIFDDGRSPLHVAAELTNDTNVLEFLCRNGSITDLNRQDNWGWTPLHWSILSELHGQCTVPFQKARFLLGQGADLDIKGGNVPGLFEDEYTPLELSVALRPTLLSEFIAVLKDSGRPIPADLEDEAEVFHDAVDVQTP